MRHWRRMEKIKCLEKLNNEEVLERIGGKGTLVNNILHWKANWIGHILRRYCLFLLCNWKTDDTSERNKKKNTAS